MTTKKHILTILLIVFLFLLIGAVSAADIDTNDTQTISASDNDEIIKVENDFDKLKDTAEGNYSDLRDEIESGSGDIKLNKTKYMDAPPLASASIERSAAMPVHTSFPVKRFSSELKQDMEQETDSKSEKEYVKTVYCHPAYLTYMQSTS